MLPLVRITRRGTSLLCSSAELERAAARFESEHALRLPGFIDVDLLTLLHRQIDADGFTERIHAALPGRPRDLRLNQGRASARTITRHPEIQSFAGTVHRRIPDAGHEDAWHNDAVDGRLVALSVNLGEEPFEGGVLQIRDEREDRIVYELANTGAGDAVLIKIDKRLKHRVTPPEGRAPRTVFAGWFVAASVRGVLGLVPAPSV
jgi:2-oxoglutarate-Fe(II)-dependent oxygenase superfamily protein